MAFAEHIANKGIRAASEVLMQHDVFAMCSAIQKPGSIDFLWTLCDDVKTVKQELNVVSRWFWGKLSRTEAEQHLLAPRNDPGVFMVRERENKEGR